MIFSQLSSIPDFFPEDVKASLGIEKMGIRFLDEKRFRNAGLTSLQDSFASFSPEQKKILIAFLRETLRSACVLPTLLPKTEQQPPLLTASSYQNFNLKNFINEVSNQNLALPVFAVDLSYESLFQIYCAVLASHYRGPIFLASQHIHSEFQELGVLNHIPSQYQVLNHLNSLECFNSLKKLLWFRNVILPLSEPWMTLGYPKKV